MEAAVTLFKYYCRNALFIQRLVGHIKKTKTFLSLTLFFCLNFLFKACTKNKANVTFSIHKLFFRAYMKTRLLSVFAKILEKKIFKLMQTYAYALVQCSFNSQFHSSHFYNIEQMADNSDISFNILVINQTYHRASTFLITFQITDYHLDR